MTAMRESLKTVLELFWIVFSSAGTRQEKSHDVTGFPDGFYVSIRAKILPSEKVIVNEFEFIGV